MILMFTRYFKPYFGVTKHFQESIYIVIFQKYLINILYANVFFQKKTHLLNVYKITQETENWKRFFLSIYKISQEMKVLLKMFFEHS